MAIYAGIFCELKPDRGAFFSHRFVTFFRRTAALDPSALAPLRDKLHHVQRGAALVAESLNAVRSGREPPMIASVQTLELRAEGLM